MVDAHTENETGDDLEGRRKNPQSLKNLIVEILMLMEWVVTRYQGRKTLYFTTQRQIEESIVSRTSIVIIALQDD
jgi:hypothetical protein